MCLRAAPCSMTWAKIAIPDAILRKPSGLTEAERAEMMRHPEVGYRLLQSVSKPASPRLRSCWDIMRISMARGYPVAWAGERIPLGARIFSVVDSFDAMTSDRPYRLALSDEEASEEIVALCRNPVRSRASSRHFTRLTERLGRNPRAA